MNKRGLIRALVAGEKVDRCGFWLGNPHVDAWPILHRYFGTRSEPELRAKLGDDVRWVPSVYCEVEASSHPYEIPEGAAPPDELFPVVWDAEQGQVARNTGKFTTHITLEPRKGYHRRY